MKIAIFGAGGLGAYLGGFLARAGEEVSLIARGEHLRAIQAQGLRVQSVRGDFVVRPALATDNPAEVGIVDAVIVCVKAWQVSDAAEAMRPMVGSETFVVPVQNGVEASGQLATILGPGHVLGGVYRVVSSLAGPGYVKHLYSPTPDQGGAEFSFGELDSHPSERAEKLRSALEGAGISAEIANDVQVSLWDKFLAINSLSGMGAVTRSPIGAWRDILDTRQMAVEAMREVLSLAIARGVALTEDSIRSGLANLDNAPADATLSMQRDIMAGNPSELEYHNGAVVRMGREVGVNTPINAFIYQSLLPQELASRGETQA